MRKNGIIGFFIIAGLIYFGVPLIAQGEEDITENAIENQKCLQCHGEQFYFYYNDWVEQDVKAKMNPFRVIDSTDFYNSNHKTFACTDCHSSDYEEFPHDGSLMMEPKYSCMDCHEDDDDFPEYHFEEIKNDFQQSVHIDRHGEVFTCWMCHNPHTYHINARTSESVVNTVAYSNGICLTCHADMDMYMYLSDEEDPMILSSHDWLPNKDRHFSKVRCIECHAQINDSLMVAHKILPKEEAVEKCVECHSSNSLLMASLYKFQSIEQRDEIGFINAAILNEAYVIGATRNYYLNVISLVVFGLVLIGIFIHSILRIIIKNSSYDKRKSLSISGMGEAVACV